MKIRLIDAHCHLNFEDYTPDLAATIARAEETGVGMIVVGTTIATSRRAIALAEAHQNIWAIVGIHPIYAHKHVDMTDIEDLEVMARHTRVVGLGECGFDYFHMIAEGADMHRCIEAQKHVFMEQIRIANECKKPLMLHLRNAPADKVGLLPEHTLAALHLTGNAYNDALTLVQAHSKTRGNAHFFAGTMEHLYAFMALNFTVSFTGVITFAKDYESLVRRVPADRVLVETDSPYVAPAPHRGKRNEPAYVVEVAEKMAAIRGEMPDVLMEQTLQNTCDLFGITL